MMTALDADYAYCRRLAQRSASSFYYAFLLLPREKRRAMYALYAFLRRTDDLADGDRSALPAARGPKSIVPVRSWRNWWVRHDAPASGPPSSSELDRRRLELDQWRTDLQEAWEGRSDQPILTALADTMNRYQIPRHYLLAVLDGVEMDLAGCRYETWDDLEVYCHRVASVVGLSCVYIWGFEGEDALESARKCGLAFQLTNILRDLKEDAEIGRIYLPSEDLRRFAYSPDDLRQGIRDARFQGLMQFEIDRAEEYYREGAALERQLSADGRPIFRALLTTYRGLLDQIRQLDGDVFTSRVRISRWRRVSIALRAMFRRPVLAP